VPDYTSFQGVLLTGATFEIVVEAADPETEEVLSTESVFVICLVNTISQVLIVR
jgi:hypothetical protein